VPVTEMENERRVRLFKNGRNQALRIPREFELPGNEAIIRREGNRLIVESLAHPSLLAVLAGLKPVEEDSAELGDLPPNDVALCGLRHGITRR
jgi:antitoxin VapB